MKKRDYTDFIFDIFESLKDIQTFVENMNYEAFINDKKTKLAVVIRYVQ
jgi:uncharacterized protein with HEPN domain